MPNGERLIPGYSVSPAVMIALPGRQKA